MNSREIADEIFRHVENDDLQSANLLFHEAVENAREGRIEPRPKFHYGRFARAVVVILVGAVLCFRVLSVAAVSL